MNPAVCERQRWWGGHLSSWSWQAHWFFYLLLLRLLLLLLLLFLLFLLPFWRTCGNALFKWIFITPPRWLWHNQPWNKFAACCCLCFSPSLIPHPSLCLHPSLRCSFVFRSPRRRQKSISIKGGEEFIINYHEKGFPLSRCLITISFECVCILMSLEWKWFAGLLMGGEGGGGNLRR